MDWVKVLLVSLGYPGIVIIIALENLYPPIPSELILPFIGFMTTRGEFTPWGVIVASTLGSVLSALILYGVGRLVPQVKVIVFARAYGRYLSISEQDVVKAAQWFNNRGAWTVLWCRMVPVLRSLISIPAGLAHMPIIPFSLFTLAGSLLWNGILVLSGVLLGERWSSVVPYIDRFEIVLVVLVVLVAAIGLFTHWRKRHR